MIDLMRPGRVAIRTMRSPRRTASRTLCVTNTTVFLVSSQTRSISSYSDSRVCASSAANGSSINNVPGSQTSARARAPRCRMPPDSVWMRLSLNL